MEELGAGVDDVFAGTEIIVHMKNGDAKLDQNALEAVLVKYEVKPKGDVKKDPKYIL